jgi:uncharacterized Zn finger protein
MYGYGGYFRPYVSVAERRKKAEKAAAKLTKKGEKVTPVKVDGRLIAKTFWGKAWCDHLESFSDYENRLPRGRTYLRNGSVIHLNIGKGRVEGLVQGSSLYKIKIEIKCVDPKKWNQILDNCSGEIDSVIELLQGKLSSGVMKTITDKQRGLFPHPKEISLKCSCPDWAEMCKHVAAVLYGVGAKLDIEPELLFKLRHADHLDLINKATLKVSTKRTGKTRVIKDQDLSSLFGIEIDSQKVPDSTSSAAKPAKRVSKKVANKSAPISRGRRKG